MAKLPDVDEWARKLGKKGAQYALELLEQEYGVSAARLRELAEAALRREQDEKGGEPE